MKIISAIISVSLTLLIGVVASADDGLKPAAKEAGRGRGKNAPVVRRLMQPFKAVEMADEQKTMVMAKAGQTATKIAEEQEEHGITMEVIKARSEAVKAMKDSELKGKEKQAAIDKEAGLSDEQSEGMREVTEMTKSFQKEVFAMLSDEQKASLPDRLVKQLGSKGKAGGKKDKKNDD